MKNPYLLLTPGPLSTSESVRSAMLRDWCTWDTEYNSIVQEIRKRLVGLAGVRSDAYTSVLMQGSGTFTVESVIGTVIPKETGKLLVVINGAYGKRMAEIAKMLDIPTIVCAFEEHETINMEQVMILLEEHQDITHVAMVHCETTTGILNPIKEFCDVAKRYNKVTIIDAMSSFGGMPIMIEDLQIDFLISSANKCIQGVPGFGFVIANRKKLEECQGNARSLSLDLYSQYKTMEEHGGKWRFTSPTHVVRAFYQALIELEEEGGIMARHQRYVENQWILVEGMVKLGFKPFLHKGIQSPIITSFYYPKVSDFQFEQFYGSIKEKGFVIYPGKISQVDTFRIGNIGEVYPKDIHRLLEAIETTIALDTKGVR